MRKRLTLEQKQYAIMAALCKRSYPQTPTQIAKEIGFSKAHALYAALDQLTASGFVTFFSGQFFDHTSRWFFPTPLGRQKYCELTVG